MAGGKKKEPIVVAQIMGKWVGGGVEAVIMNYYRHIDRTKVQFDFICDEDSTNIPYGEIEKLGGKVILCPPYQKIHKYMKFLEKLFREKKYRIVHSNINTLSVFPLRAAKKAGVKVRIAHSHSTSNPKEWKKNLLKNTLRPFSKKYATDYFACSEHAGRYLFGDKSFNAGKVTIIPNAIDIEMFKYDPIARKKLRKEIGLRNDDFVIGHIGRFVKQKNHAFLIDVFAEVKKENAKLVLVGQGPLREEIENKVKKLGLEKDVFFLGQRNDANKLYSVFDVFCLPSLYEGLGVVAIEAQINERKLLLSDKVPVEAIISDKAERLELDCRRWSSALNVMLDSGCMKKYSIAVAAKKMGSLYEEK
jgi:glycosyltransferase EpsF